MLVLFKNSKFEFLVVSFIFYSSLDLSAAQQEWIADSVRFGNVTKDWPSLSQQQLQQLETNVEQLNRGAWPANFPYYQAGEVTRPHLLTKLEDTPTFVDQARGHTHIR